MAAATTDLPPSNTPPYWCHTCSRAVTVNPTTAGGPALHCPYCNTGFLEQMTRGSIPLLLPLLLGLVASPANPSPSPVSPETPSSDGGPETRHGREEGQVDERIILIDPANQAIFIQTRSSDELLSEFIENDILRNGWLFGGGGPSSSPASKKAVEAMARVVMVDDEEAQCAVCLEGFGADGEAREMPCKHRYHDGCIIKWLEKHNTCPVCRFQMPVEEKKPAAGGGVGEEEEGRRRRRRRTVVLSVPLDIDELMSLRRREATARSDADSETVGQESGSALEDQRAL